MENNNSQGYRNLGKKVLWLFFLRNLPFPLIIMFGSFFLFFISYQPFITNNALANIQNYIISTSFFLLIISLVGLIIALLIAVLYYTNYLFLLDNDSFRIRKGILYKTENAIPYRQIQNIDIERSIFFQMLGLCRFIILTAGREDELQKGNSEAEGIIPAIDEKTALWLQGELLKRAEIQKTIAA